MSTNTSDVEAGLQELRDLLRGDGADLELIAVDDSRPAVHLRLDLSRVSCVECVLPPDVLDELVRDGMRRRVAPDLEVVLDDPRRS